MSSKDKKDGKYVGYNTRFNPKLASEIQGASLGYTNTPFYMANPQGQSQLQIQFYHIATRRRAEFPAFITGLSDSYSSNWDATSAMGRMDPIMNFRNTTRNITLSFDIPSANKRDAEYNMAEVNRLIQFLYPTYTAGTSQIAKTMAGSPLVKVQFQNLIHSAKGTRTNERFLDLFTDAKENGLICAITSLNATPNLDVGFFGSAKESSAPTLFDALGLDTSWMETPKDEQVGVGFQFPKLWQIDLSLTVVHDHSLSATFKNASAFPYGGATREFLASALGEKRDGEDQNNPIVQQEKAGTKAGIRQKTSSEIAEATWSTIGQDIGEFFGGSGDNEESAE